MSDAWFTKEQILNIKEENLPLMVLSYDYRSFLSTGIAYRTSGAYNHLMWMHKSGKVASQDWFFHEVDAKKYMAHHRLKFWTNKTWTKRQKDILKLKVRAELLKPRWKTRYDFLAIFGQLIGITGIQTPWTNICSDHANYLKLIDNTYNLVHPSPTDVNEWLKINSDYEVFARFVND